MRQFLQFIHCWLRGIYPPAYSFKHWAWKWDKNGNVKYNHLKTYVNYLKSK